MSAQPTTHEDSVLSITHAAIERAQIVRELRAAAESLSYVSYHASLGREERMSLSTAQSKVRAVLKKLEQM